MKNQYSENLFRKKAFENILWYLELDICSKPFKKPVDWQKFGLFDYPEVIKKPICLEDVFINFKNNKYKNEKDVLDDIQLIWDNCKTYNREDSQIHKEACLMENSFNKLVEKYLGYKYIPELKDKVIEPINKKKLKKGKIEKKEKKQKIDKEEKRIKNKKKTESEKTDLSIHEEEINKENLSSEFLNEEEKKNLIQLIEKLKDSHYIKQFIELFFSLNSKSIRDSETEAVIDGNCIERIHYKTLIEFLNDVTNKQDEEFKKRRQL